tara:strand:+ start:114 stop:656 length:543 start_codon:yes stop_codon:yes gene_type:complete
LETIGEDAVRGLRGEEVTARGDTLEVDKSRALSDTVAGGNDNVSKSVHLGLLSELRFKVEAVDRGLEVYDPVSPVSKADFVTRKPGNRPLLVQVKRAHLAPSGGWRFLCCAIHPGKGPVHYLSSDFDVYAIHVDDGGQHSFGFWPASALAGKHSKTWHPGKNGPLANNWEVLEREGEIFD